MFKLFRNALPVLSVVSLLIAAALIWLMVDYRRKPSKKMPARRAVITIILTVALILAAVAGFIVFFV